MIPRLVARSSAVLRCAVCHGDLPRRRWTCPGCNTTLHHDCVRSRADCPTLGCGRLVTRPVAKTTPSAPALEALIFYAPAALTFFWPVWFCGLVLLRDALGLAGPVFIGPSLDYLVPMLLGALAVGPAVGHLGLAAAASRRGIGGQHRRAALGAATGLALSLLIVLFLLSR